MKIVVVGGSGLIGSKTVERLRRKGHEVVPASPNTGVNTVTGEGLAAALKGADVVLDVSNSPSFDDKPAMEFFQASTGNLLGAETAAGVKHHVALSVVGTENLQESGYFRAKLVQENLIKASKIPYTIVHATQFFEFIGAIAQGGIVGNTIRVSNAYMQPIAASDVAEVMAATCFEAPINGTIEIAGPERVRQNEIVETYLRATGDQRPVVGSPDALYYGIKLNEQSLLPGHQAKLGPTKFTEWLKAAAITK